MNSSNLQNSNGFHPYGAPAYLALHTRENLDEKLPGVGLITLAFKMRRLHSISLSLRTAKIDIRDTLKLDPDKPIK